MGDMSFQVWGDVALPLGFGRATGTSVAPPTLGSETLAAMGRTTETGLRPPSMLLAWPSHVASGARRGQNSLGLFVLP